MIFGLVVESFILKEPLPWMALHPVSASSRGSRSLYPRAFPMLRLTSAVSSHQVSSYSSSWNEHFNFRKPKFHKKRRRFFSPRSFPPDVYADELGDFDSAESEKTARILDFGANV